MQTREYLFAILRYKLCGTRPDEEILRELASPEKLSSLYALSKKHDLSHIAACVFDLIEKTPENAEIAAKFKKAMFAAVSRNAKLVSEYAGICECLEDIGIDYIPLKGSVLRDMYPEPWMRTSSDIDILVREEELDFAADALCEKLSYEKKPKGRHDQSLLSPTGVLLELHFRTVEDGRAAKADEVLENIWEYASGQTHKKCLSDEMFYFYHIAHMAKHFGNGGCGIRYFADLYILNTQDKEKIKKRSELLDLGGLLQFEKSVCELANYWFSGEKTPDGLLPLENFVVTGGIYGNLESAVRMRSAKEKSDSSYLIERIFQPYELLQYRFPEKMRHKIFLPVMWVCRWSWTLFGGNTKKYVNELNYRENLDDKEKKELAELFDNIGL